MPARYDRVSCATGRLNLSMRREDTAKCFSESETLVRVRADGRVFYRPSSLAGEGNHGRPRGGRT